MTEHIIPRCDGMLSGLQPYRMDILVNDKEAVMSQADFDLLKEYTFSNPTGVYAGRMWKAKCHLTDRWMLRWYGGAVMRGGQEVHFTHQRLITIMDWKALTGTVDP